MPDFDLTAYFDHSTTLPLSDAGAWPDISHHDPKFQTLVHLERAAMDVNELIGVLLATKSSEKYIDWLHGISAHLDKVRQPLIVAAFPDRADHA
jgi:hypothetical protein